MYPVAWPFTTWLVMMKTMTKALTLLNDQDPLRYKPEAAAGRAF